MNAFHKKENVRRPDVFCSRHPTAGSFKTAGLWDTSGLPLSRPVGQSHLEPPAPLYQFICSNLCQPADPQTTQYWQEVLKAPWNTAFLTHWYLRLTLTVFVQSVRCSLWRKKTDRKLINISINLFSFDSAGFWCFNVVSFLHFCLNSEF